jgi:NAD(P)H-hydrate epimerase
VEELEGEAALTRAQAREIDRLALEELGIPGLVLMENAGLGATLRLLDLDWRRTGRVAVLCGRGNNAGDGYVVARQLVCRGLDVCLWESRGREPLPPDAEANRAVSERMGIERRPLAPLRDAEAVAAELRGFALIVDALLGTGFQGTVRPPLDAWIEGANLAHSLHGVPIAALDLPSGLDADSGRPSNATVRADWTLTFVAPKVGFRAQGAKPWTGQVFTVPIGTPPALLERLLARARDDERKGTNPEPGGA